MEIDFSIKKMGDARYPSPLANVNFVGDNKKILYNIDYSSAVTRDERTEANLTVMELAGPRERLYYDPRKVTAGIVSCGGLCPGINNVIRALFMQLNYQYGVPTVLGFRYGYRGICKNCSPGPITLTVDDVEPIHNRGGSILGSSRGGADVTELVDGLEHYGVNMLFTIGGDGTIRGSMEVESEINRRGLAIAIVNIPKTIDNDIPFISKSFGFQTAFSEAVESIRCAHNEAKGAPNGIGIVKLMGRNSGFIAAHATLAQEDVNYLLVPEADFDLDGPNGLLAVLEKRLERSHHALIVVAEGAGQKYFEGGETRLDGSGNVLLDDIGLYLKDRIKAHFKELKIETNVKYIDPSYIIRSVPAIPEDAIYCGILAEHAVHAAMSGRTRMVIGRWNARFVHIPMDIVQTGRKQIDQCGGLWQSVLLSTGQPALKN
ncbi:MAG: ATP-dependent 6-phosphofructokinase [Candidatus Marinimicrobia bacterium]|nr:ATP-dependent 6-phosphofructokinase [Candidatus Neomarinimicrobiota bacterium]